MSRYSNDPGEYPWPAEYVPQQSAARVAAPTEQLATEARCAESSGWASGARTVDDYGDMGTILYVEDDHNVHVALDGGGRAIYCCHVGCAEYFPCRLVSSPNTTMSNAGAKTGNLSQHE